MATQKATKNKEEWRPVVGYEGWFEVSNLGRVKRAAPGRGTWVGRILKCQRHHTGYIHVVLSRNSRERSHFVHVLVLEAFVCPRPRSQETNHKDGDKQNNRIGNLEWVTTSQNARHKVHTLRDGWITKNRRPRAKPRKRQGKYVRGSASPRAKLLESDIPRIRKRLKRGHLLREVAKDFGVSPEMIWRIKVSLAWCHV